MYAQVVVLTYQPPNVDSYTYKIPEDLNIKVGHLVEVPFGKRNPRGIIISTSNHQPTANYQIKPITKTLFPHPILLTYQVKLLKWISEYYFAPMADCLGAMLPEIPKRLSDYSEPNYPTTKLSNYQTLILVPTINQIPQTLAKFPKARNHTIYHNEMKMSERFKVWLKILGANTDFVFGSRGTIFAPFANLKEIIIYDEHDSAYKNQRSPYFDTLTIAQKISELTKSQIRIVDASPKITTYFQLKNHIKMQKFGINSKIISLIEEKQAGNFSPISSYLQNELQKNQNILLFLNKKKESGNLFCKNCKYNDYFEKHPQYCPKCKSQDIYFNVLNIDSLKLEVKKFTKNPNVDVQTATIFYAPTITKYDLAVYIQPDSLLSRADFASSEILFSQITNLKKLLKENGQILIQTYNPEDVTIKSAISGNYGMFFKSQIEYRKLLKYPPYSLLIKLAIKGKNRNKVERSAHQLFSNLNSTIQLSNYPTIQLLGPYEPIFFSKIPSSNIIIKYKLGSYSLKERKEAIKKIVSLINKIDKKIQITVEPQSLY